MYVLEEKCDEEDKGSDGGGCGMLICVKCQCNDGWYSECCDDDCFHCG